MTRDDITRMAREAGFVGFDGDNKDLRRFAALVAQAERERMTKDGWRQCAEGQRTTQHCGLVEAAIATEREACARVCEELDTLHPACIAVLIRERGSPVLP